MENTNSDLEKRGNQNDFPHQLLNALIHFLYQFVNFLFVLPYHLWQKAVIRLDYQFCNKTLNVGKIDSPWPFFSWLKRFILEFLLDGLIFIWWLVALIFFFVDICGSGMSFWDYLSVLYLLYVSGPFVLSLLRDFIVTCILLPFRKFLSWVRKPAQYMDVKHDGTIKNN